ncbi:hypothetical protein RRG08_022553 [Elysia crispata]|uniref:Uncharacterized protein n=1 Tax=Elysia crispata TaxID=231223 RepID=A0AAE0Z1E5_9GAST|nr:hypothetical protein RRG08_022553 [Elysia crispata]
MPFSQATSQGLPNSSSAQDPDRARRPTQANHASIAAEYRLQPHAITPGRYPLTLPQSKHYILELEERLETEPGLEEPD